MLEQSNLEWALKYAKVGWRVIPLHWVSSKNSSDGAIPFCSCHKKERCSAMGKHPIFDNWTELAATDESKIREWFAFYPYANIGIATGKKSGIFCLDIDPRNGGDATVENWQNKGFLFGDTPTSETGSKGSHIVYKIDMVSDKLPKEIAPGVDVKGEGGQFVVEPSSNMNGAYIWKEGRDPTEIKPIDPPDWLISLLSAAKISDGEKPHYDMEYWLSGAASGNRKTKAVQGIGKLRGADVPYDAAWDLVQKYAIACTPEWDLDEAKETLNDIYHRYNPNKPWEKIQAPIPKRFRYDPQEWEEPVDFRPPKPINFPIHLFPDWIENFVTEISNTIQISVDVGALCVLSVISTALAKKVVMHINDSWSCPTNIYTCSALESGGGKSPIFTACQRPLLNHQAALQKSARGKVLFHKHKMDILANQINEIKRKLSKEPNPNTEVELKQKTDEFAAKDRIFSPLLCADDVTPEELGNQLYEQSERMAIFSAEGGIFKKFTGQYAAMPNNEIYMKAYTGERLHIARVGQRDRPGFEINNLGCDLRSPALTLAISVQPHLLNGLDQNENIGKLGLLARFLWSVPDSLIGSRVIQGNLQWKYSTLYNECIERLLKVEPDKPENIGSTAFVDMVPHDIRFLPAAQQAYEDWCNSLEKRFQKGGTLSTHGMKEWGSKFKEGMARVIALLHVAEWVEMSDPWKRSIDEEYVDKILELSEYFIQHAVIAHERMRGDSARPEAEEVLEWVVIKNVQKISQQDIFRIINGRNIKEATALLCNCGYLRIEDSTKRNPIYEINPKWDKAKWEKKDE